jgi:acetyltransferase-like isoleucine patch superfamily enzyme
MARPPCPNGVPALSEPEPYARLESVSAIPISLAWVELGSHTYFGHLQLGAWYPGEKVVIGKYCSIANETVILTGGGHRSDIATTYPIDIEIAMKERGRMARQPSRSAGVGLAPHTIDMLHEACHFFAWRAIRRTYQSTRNTTIGNDVWIGYRSMILGGAHVGDGAVIAAGSVVFTDVPPYAIVAGNPAEIVRYRFSKAIVERLLRITWWNWSEEKIRENIEWFYRPIIEFVEQFDPPPHG